MRGNFCTRQLTLSGCTIRLHQRTRFSGVSPQEMRRMFSAISFARASIMPSVQPETCGVISTFGSSWNGLVAGAVEPASRG